MPVNGNRKGKAGEREFAQFLRDHGFEAKRGQQHAGGADSPDVVSNVPGVHFEVKRTESLSLWPAMEQAARDSGDQMPVVVHRPSRRQWIAIMPADQFLDLARAANGLPLVKGEPRPEGNPVEPAALRPSRRRVSA